MIHVSELLECMTFVDQELRGKQVTYCLERNYSSQAPIEQDENDYLILTIIYLEGEVSVEESTRLFTKLYQIFCAREDEKNRCCGYPDAVLVVERWAAAT